MSKQAQAGAQAAKIVNSYRRIVATSDGLVTKRLISPGVVVNPGMMILKLAHVNQMRLQAEVASEDAGKIQVGDPVYFKASEDGAERRTQITSIFPAADPASRTFVVEALIDNLTSIIPGNGFQQAKSSIEILKGLTGYRFLPGQYVVMRIVTGEKTALTIPTRAVSWREGHAQAWKAIGAASGSGKYTCLMHPEVISDKPGNCPKCDMKLVPKESRGRLSAQLVDIKVGLSNQKRTEVTEGLKEGDSVIYEGQSDLQPGMPVVATQWGKNGPAKLPQAADVASNRLDSSNKWTAEQVAGDLMVKLSITPLPPRSGSNSLIATLTEHGANSIRGARITGKTSMPTMSMPGPDLSASSAANGNYVMKSDFMSGLWEVRLSIAAQNRAPQELTFEIEVP